MNCRRGFTIIQLLVLIPLMGGVTWMATEVMIRSIRIQGIVARQMETEARMADMIRRLRIDVGGVARGGVEVSKDGCQLRLASPDRVISYRVMESRLVRETTLVREAPLVPESLAAPRSSSPPGTSPAPLASSPASQPSNPLVRESFPAPLASSPASQPSDRSDSHYAWDLRGLRLAFQVEPIGADDGLVWMKFAVIMQTEKRFEWDRRFSTAALIGREVVR